MSVDHSRLRSALRVGVAVAASCAWLGFLAAGWIVKALSDDLIMSTLLRIVISFAFGAWAAAAGLRAGKWWYRRGDR